MRNLQRTFFCVLAGVLVLAIYVAGLSAPFFFDDLPNIVLNAPLHVSDLSVGSLRAAVTGGAAGFSGRPVALLSFALNYFCCDLDPFYYRLTNVLIHWVNGLLVFTVTRHILHAHFPRDEAWNVLPAIVAVAWLVHPMQFLVVEHVVQRMAALSAFFVLTGFLLHIRAREKAGGNGAVMFFLCWGLCLPLAFLSKESGALLPGFILAWELTLRRSQGGGLDTVGRWYASGAGILACGGLVYLATPAAGWLFAGYEGRDFSLGERVLTECRIVVFYLGQILFPRLGAFGLHHDDFVVSRSLFDTWETLVSPLLLVGLLGSALAMATRFPLACFGVLWFFVGHALESTILPLELVHEHRNYLPLFGILLMLISLGYAGWRESAKRARALVFLSVLVLLWWVSLTAMRAHQYGDEIRRTQMEALNHPASARAQQDAGSVLAALPESSNPESEIYRLARWHLGKAGEVDAAFKLNWVALMQMNCRAGLPIEDAWAKTLMERLAGKKFAPGDRTVLFALKELAINYPRCLDNWVVEGAFDAALKNPGMSLFVAAILHSWHADYYWLVRHDMTAASAALDRSLHLNPSNLSNQLKRAQLYFISGNIARSKQMLKALPLSALSSGERQTARDLFAMFAD